MNIFARQEMAERKAFKPEAVNFNEKKLAQAAEKIRQSSKHELMQLMQDPYWIKKTIESKEKKVTTSFKKNLKRACEIIADEKGYDVNLVLKIYELLEKKVLH